MARRLAPRRVDETERGAVEQEANRHARFAEQPLEPRVRAGAPAVVMAIGRRRAVEVGLRLFDPDEQQPLAGALRIRHRAGRGQIGLRTRGARP